MSSLAGKSKGEDRDPGFSDEVVKIFKVEGEEKQLRNYIRWVVVLLILVSKKMLRVNNQLSFSLSIEAKFGKG